jgi:four helix bundle protein
MEAGT